MKRMLGGLLATALIVIGLVPTVASAAATAVLTKTLTANSSLGDYPVGNAGDGNQNSYWESSNNAFPQWIRADLGSSVAVDRIVLKLPAAWGARTQTLAVQTSTNGTSYADLVASAGYNFTPASNNTVTITFPATTARYVRLNITGNTGWAAGQLSEFELHGPDTGGDNQAPTAPGNLALTEPVSGQIRLAWNASTDNVGVTGYTVYRNNAAVTTVAGNVLTFTESQPASATVEYYVRARDAAGNESGDSNRVRRNGQSNGPTSPTASRSRPPHRSTTSLRPMPTTTMSAATGSPMASRPR